MKHQKILNLLNEANDSISVTRKQNTVNDQSNATYDVANKIIYNTEVLKSKLSDWTMLTFSKRQNYHHSSSCNASII